jgi:hypothetical protein
MSAHGIANQIAGDCINVPQRICNPFKEFCIHTLLHSPDIGQPTDPEAGSYGCMANTVNLGTKIFPSHKVPSNTNRAPIYGKTTTTKTLPFYYKAADLDPWRPRKIIGAGDIYNKYTSGPAINQGHMVTEVMRRLFGSTPPNNDSYLNRYNYYFTDSTTSIGGEDDWLRFMHPAWYFWTNKGLNEPFLAVDYYEQSGQLPTTTDVYNQNFIPFCSPLDVYSDSSGLTKIGQFIGYTFVFYFGFAYFKVPTNTYLAEDYHIVPQTIPATLVNPTNQFMTLDCQLFMVSSPSYGGSPIYSPKLQSVRYWFYNKFGISYDPCSQYFYFLNGQQTSEWKFDLSFNKVSGGTDTIKFGLSNLQVYVTP